MCIKDRIILLKDLGLSYAFMSTFVGLHPTTIGKYVSGRLDLRAENLEKLDELTFNLCVALGVE